MKTKNIAQIVNEIKTETKILAVSFIIILLSTGCSPTTPNNNDWDDLPSYHKIEGIPFVEQTTLGTSFSVAAEMALRSLGMDVDWMELYPIIQNGGLQDRKALVEYAENLGFEAGSYHFDLGDLLHLTYRDVRIVAQIKNTLEDINTICKVPNGYNISKEEIYLNDSWTGGEITIPFDDFSKYGYNIAEMNDWTGVLIYDKNISIEDLNLTPHPYPSFKNYKTEEDQKGLGKSIKEASKDYFGKEIIENGEKRFNELLENKDNSKPKYNDPNNLGKQARIITLLRQKQDCKNYLFLFITTEQSGEPDFNICRTSLWNGSAFFILF